MKVATYRVGGERRVGVVDERRATVSAFDLPLSEAEAGLTALLARDPLPDRLSPTPLSEVRLEAPIPRPRRNREMPRYLALGSGRRNPWNI